MSLGIIQILILAVNVGIIAAPFIIREISNNRKISRGEPVEELPPYKWGYTVAIVIGINGSMILISSLLPVNIIGIIPGLLVLYIGYGIFHRSRIAWIAAIMVSAIGWVGTIILFGLGGLLNSVISLVITSLFFFYSCFYAYSRWQEFHPFSYRSESEKS